MTAGGLMSYCNSSFVILAHHCFCVRDAQWASGIFFVFHKATKVMFHSAITHFTTRTISNRENLLHAFSSSKPGTSMTRGTTGPPAVGVRPGCVLLVVKPRAASLVQRWGAGFRAHYTSPDYHCQTYSCFRPNKFVQLPCEAIRL